MKNIKKLSLITLFSVGAIFTAACSQEATKKPGQAEQANSKTKHQEILQKVIDNNENLKSISLNIETENKDGLRKSKVSVNKDPMFVKIQNEDTDGDSYQQYVDSEFVYYSDYYSTTSPATLVWSKTKATKSDKLSIDTYLLDLNLIYFNTNSSYSLTSNETDTTYEFTFDTANPADFKDPNTNESYKKYIVKYIIDKNSLLVKSSEVNSTTKADTTEKIKTEYSNYNAPVDTNLPKEAAEAKEK